MWAIIKRTSIIKEFKSKEEAHEFFDNEAPEGTYLTEIKGVK